MQNVAQGTTSDSQKSHEKQSAAPPPPPPPPSSSSASVHHDTGKTSSTPQSSNSSPTKSETETFSELQPRFMTDSSESEEDSVSEVNAKRGSPSRNVIRLSVCTACRGQDMRVRERMGTERWNEKGRERERERARDRERKGGRGGEKTYACVRDYGLCSYMHTCTCVGRASLCESACSFLTRILSYAGVIRRRFPSPPPPPPPAPSPVITILSNVVHCRRRR